MSDRKEEMDKLEANLQEVLNAHAIQEEAKDVGIAFIKLLTLRDTIDPNSPQAQTIRDELDSLSKRIQKLKERFPE